MAVLFLRVTTSETEIKQVLTTENFTILAKLFTCNHGLKSFACVVKMSILHVTTA